MDEQIKMKKIVRYGIRSVKYFIYCGLFLVVVLYVLSLLGMVEWDVDALFDDGIKSVWKIIAMLAAIAFIYPYVGFQTRMAMIRGSWAERRDEFVAVMQEKGYVLVRETEDGAVFRRRGLLSRLTRMLEDGIVVTQAFGGFELEGLRKDIVRLTMHLEYQLGEKEEQTAD